MLIAQILTKSFNVPGQEEGFQRSNKEAFLEKVACNCVGCISQSTTATPIHQLLCDKDLDGLYHRVMSTTPHLESGQAHNCFDQQNDGSGTVLTPDP